jgi:predicted Zn-dependent protease
VQGNGLAGPQVIDAMERAFLNTRGTLSDRLLAALVAGDAAGGQKTGRESAALLVRTTDGFPLDVDLRVDHSANPVADLVKLYNLQAARQQVIEAGIEANRGQYEQAKASLFAAVARANDWPRVTIRAAKTAEQIEEPQLALQYITMAFSQNPAWALEEIGAGDFAELGASPLFHRWVSAEQQQRALEAYHKISDPKQASLEEPLDVSRKLLEAGHPQEALALLNSQPDGAGQAIQFDLLRAQAYSAEGNDAGALEQCMHAQKQDPQNTRVRLRIARLKQKADLR